MSMGSLFSSPSKEAQSAATAQQGLSDQTVAQIEQYTQQQQQNLQNAILGQGSNPYFSAAQAMSPASMAVNPNDTTTFGNAGPGTTFVAPNQGQTIPGNPFAGSGTVTSPVIAQRAPSDGTPPPAAPTAPTTPTVPVAPGVPYTPPPTPGNGGANFHGVGNGQGLRSVQ